MPTALTGQTAALDRLFLSNSVKLSLSGAESPWKRVIRTPLVKWKVFQGGFPGGGRIIAPALIGAVLSLSIVVASIYILYSAALEKTQDMLMESARNQASLIDAVARFDARFSSQDHPDGSWGATYSQVLAAMAINATPASERWERMEILREKNGKMFLISQREKGKESETEIPAGSKLEAAAYQALAGEGSIYSGPDGSGKSIVMALYPVLRMNITVAFSVDALAVQKPFRNAAFWTVGISLLLWTLWALCSGWILRQGAPLPEARGTRKTAAVPPPLFRVSSVNPRPPASADASTIQVLKRVLVECLPQGETGIKQIAPRMNMSARTLQRLLKGEGHTYSQVLLATRKRLCVAYLHQREFTLEQIADRLGYANAANFHRAFKREIGLTPIEYRNRHSIPSAHETPREMVVN